MEKFPLMRLSAELRNRIYAEVFLNPEGITIDCQEYMKRATVTLSHISLTRTCQQLRRETLQMYYFSNSTTILAPYSHPPAVACSEVWRNFNAVRNMASAAQISALQRVSLELLIDVDQYSGDICTLDRAKIQEIRGMFHPAACFEVRFDVGWFSLNQFFDNEIAAFNVAWDIDQPVEQLKARLAAAAEEEESGIRRDPQTSSILSAFVLSLVGTGICRAG